MQKTKTILVSYYSPYEHFRSDDINKKKEENVGS